MNFFESRYFNINKGMLKFLGLWPYQDRRTKILKCIMVNVIACICIIPQVISICKNIGVNISVVLQSTATALCFFFVTIKHCTTMVIGKKMKKLYENIDNNWKRVKEPNEIKTLERHSEAGRFLTIAYIIYLSLAVLSFISAPMVPSLIIKLLALNISLPRMFILESEFPFDRYEYYTQVFIFESSMCVFMLVIICAIDSTYAVCVQHCIALVNIVKIRLDRVNRSIHEHPPILRMYESNNIHKSVTETIRFHQKTLNLANVIESSYSLNFLLITGGNVSCISIASTVILLNMHIPIQVFRHSMAVAGFMAHMFYLSLPGQQLIDACTELFNDICTCKWYAFPSKTRKNLHFIMMASKEPRRITAGGLYVMSMENFGMLVKTSLSYITVFASFLQT